ARRDANALADAGANGIIVENFGDVPFFPAAVPAVTVAAITALTRAVRDEIRAAVPVGVNVLRNDANAALAVATVAGAEFIRVNVHAGAMVTDQGIIQGRAAETLRERTRLGASTLIFADVAVKHAAPLGSDVPIAELAEEAFERGLADAIIVTGAGTGKQTSRDDLTRVRDALPDAPLLVGSGVTVDDVRDVVRIADGVIVGTALKRDAAVTNPVDEERARAFFGASPRDERKPHPRG
ncbi:BtpA/SgcQ family protein, partial [Candidatus Poribacteria bacterium]|nr:BtpA/SgcQ family protein [Candidatus Poribacteria bacterium]